MSNQLEEAHTIPPNFPQIVKSFAKSVIYVQPENVYKFAEGYFASIADNSLEAYIESQKPEGEPYKKAFSTTANQDFKITLDMSDTSTNSNTIPEDEEVSSPPQSHSFLFDSPYNQGNRRLQTPPDNVHSLRNLKEILVDSNENQLAEALKRRASLGIRMSQRRRSSLGAVDEKREGWNHTEEAENKAFLQHEREDQSLEAFQRKLRHDQERAEFVPQNLKIYSEEEMSDEAHLEAAKARGRRGSLVELAEERKRRHSESS